MGCISPLLGTADKISHKLFPGQEKNERERESGNVRCGVKAAEYDRGLFIIIVKMFVVNDVLYVSRGAVKMSRTCKTINPLTPNHSHSLSISLLLSFDPFNTFLWNINVKWNRMILSVL